MSSFSARMLSGSSVGVILSVALGTVAQAQPASSPAPAQPAAVPTLSLHECVAVGLARRPAIRAAESSYQSALLNYRGINNLPLIASLTKPELSVRKEQLLKSILLSEAGVEKARQETVYDVTRVYYTYVYARQQERTASDVIGRLEQFSKVVETFLKSKPNDPKAKANQITLNNIQNTISEARISALRAELGRRQALIGLMEAMGGDFDRDFAPRDQTLPVVVDVVSRSQVIDLAMSRRPELVMAAAGSEAFRLEICAQMKSRGLQGTTLGAGRDIHTQQIPIPVRDADYKPGGINPEMPTLIAGKKDDRVARATELSHRADASAEQVAILLRVEAEVAFITWDVATRRMAEVKKRSDGLRKISEETRMAAMFQMETETILINETAAGRALAEYTEATFEHLKTLMTLERVTGGTLQPAFPGR